MKDVEATLTGYMAVAALAVPLAGALVVGLARRAARAVRWMAPLFSGLTLLLLVMMEVLRRGGLALGFSIDVGLPFRLAFKADVLGLFLALIAGVLWLMASVYGVAYLSKRPALFNAFLLLSLYGILGIAFAANLFTLLLFFEMFSVVSAVLVIHERTPEAIAAGFQYLFMSIVGTVATILGTIVLFQTTGTLDLLGRGIPSLGAVPGAPVLFWLLAGGFVVKAGMFPLHVWLPEAHPVAPSHASALLSGVMVKAGIYGLIRVAYGIFGSAQAINPLISELLIWLALATMVVGSLVALAQVEIKRMLAYSSVSQIGHVLLGIALMTPQGLAGAVLQVLAHALAKTALFLSAGSIIAQTGVRDVEGIRGIGRRMPLTMFAFTLAALSIVGIPPSIGFFGKWQLALGALEAGRGIISRGASYGLVAAIIGIGFVTMLYYFPVIIRGWFAEPVANPVAGQPGNPGPKGGNPVPGVARVEAHWLMLAPSLLLAVATLLLGIYIRLPMGWVRAIVKLYF